MPDCVVRSGGWVDDPEHVKVFDVQVIADPLALDAISQREFRADGYTEDSPVELSDSEEAALRGSIERHRAELDKPVPPNEP